MVYSGACYHSFSATLRGNSIISVLKIKKYVGKFQNENRFIFRSVALRGSELTIGHKWYELGSLL